MEEKDRQRLEADEQELHKRLRDIVETESAEMSRVDDEVVRYALEMIEQERKSKPKIDAQERVDLYRIVKEIREGRQPNEAVSRLFVMSKLLDNDKAKVDIENIIYTWIRETGASLKTTLTGFLWIKGIYCIHLLEGDSKVLNLFLKYLYDESKKKDTIYASVVVLAFNEENPSRWFHHWGSGDVLWTGQHREDTDKNESEMHEIVWKAYDSFYQASLYLAQKLEKEKKITKNLWKDMADKINPGNEELYIMSSHHLMSIQEYYELYLDDLEIELDSEMHFPQNPTMIDILEYNDNPI